jgi:hypothetical protein
MGRPSKRSSPVTNSAVPSGRPLLSERRKRGKVLSTILQKQIREARCSIEHRTEQC